MNNNNNNFPEYFDYRIKSNTIADISSEINDKVIVNSNQSIKIHLNVREEYPKGTLFRFVIPYGWEFVNTINDFCKINSTVQGKVKITNSQLMLEYFLIESMKIGDNIEFNYNESKERKTAGDIAYIDEVYCALDIKMPEDMLYQRIWKKSIKMISDKASFFLIKLPTLFQGDPVDIEIVALDYLGNRDYEFNGKVEISGDECLEYPKHAIMENGYIKLENALKFKESNHADSSISKLLRYNTGFTQYPVVPELLKSVGKIHVRSGKISGTSNPIIRDDDISDQVYWGDTHIHTREFSDGIGTGNDAYHYAKNVVLHDFAALGDHLNQRFNDFMEGRKGILFPYDKMIWNSLIKLCVEWTDDDFVAIPGYEWSGRNIYVKIATRKESPNEAISDKVILFPIDSAGNAPLIDYASKEGCFQQQLYDALKGVECAIITHTPLSFTMGTSWTEVDKEMERIVEIYSQHGSSESIKSGYRPLVNYKKKGSVIWALNHGFKLGFIGGGDDHYSHPGCPISQHEMKNLVSILRYRPGIAAIFSEKLDSKSLIKNLNKRNCYATTGERIWIKMKINSALMGQEIEVHDPPIIIITACGTKKLESVELIKSGIVVAIRVPTFDRIKFAWEDTEIKDNEQAYYYMRVTQVDGERAWSSPIWVRAKYQNK